MAQFEILTHLGYLYTVTLTYGTTTRSTFINKQHQTQRQYMYTG